MTLITADTKYLVVGLGMTGLSCVRYLLSRNKSVSIIDSREAPPGLDDARAEFPGIEIFLGGFNQEVISRVQVLVMSPGVPLATPEIKLAIEDGVRITSDIELFLNEFSGKVIAITGSNAKSTVTQWLGEALQRSKQKILIAGNIGLPVLDAVNEEYDVAVLELSSFQLELIPSLKADVAAILNVSEDHMDRYDSMAQYQQAKQRIYFGTHHAIYNRSDMLTQPLVASDVKVSSFGIGTPDLKQYGLIETSVGYMLACGLTELMHESELALPGKHNAENALAVLALADAIGNDRALTIEALKDFSGLPYRCQFINDVNHVRYFNDSKATNVGSTIAALNGIRSEGSKNIVLLLGGQSKGQDLQPLASVIDDTCKKVFVFGQDQDLFRTVVAEAEYTQTMEEALELAILSVEEGDVVLLSPACASFDQFKNFEARGLAFNQWVEANL